MISALFVSALLALAYGQDHDCGQHKNGETVETGHFYYKCENGHLAPQGCLDKDQKRVPIGGSFRADNYQLLCKVGSDGFMTTEYDACVIQNKVVAPGAVISNNEHWYTCEKNGQFVVEQLAGCMNGDKRLKRKDRYVDGEIVYECRDTETLPEVAAVGCAVNGQQYNIGEAFEDDQYFYACAGGNGKPRKEAFGCIQNGQKLYSQQTYTVNDVVFQCKVSHKKAPKRQLIGCYDKEAGEQRKLGCRWTAGQAPFRYTLACEQTGTETVTTQRVNCIYGDKTKAGEEGFQIDPGCFRKIDNLNVGCKNTTTGVEFVTFPLDQNTVADDEGLQLC